MQAIVTVGSGPLSLEAVASVARKGARASLSEGALALIAKGRAALERNMAAGQQIYGVNTGVGGNIKFRLSDEQAELFQHNLMRQLSCATGQPLPDEVVRGAMLLRLATFATGCSAVRTELCTALVDLLNAGITPVVPRYGSVGASGDLMPSAYIGRVLIGMGEANYQGQRMPAPDALAAAGLRPIAFAAKEGLALVNGTTVMTSVAALAVQDTRAILHGLLHAVALTVEALEAPFQPYAPFAHDHKGHPGQIAVAAFIRDQFEASTLQVDPMRQSCYSLRCGPQALGPIWEALDGARPVIEREINSANDNPLIDPHTGELYSAGNFYGGHIARLLDGLKIDLAIAGNWANALMAVLVDDRFNNGLPANLVPDAGLNTGLKGMQLSVTSLACAIRQFAGPSSIHSLPTETYNQDVVSLGMHAAATAMDAIECLRNEVAMVLISAVQAIDMRGSAKSLGTGNKKIYAAIRDLSPFLDKDRALETDVAAVSNLIRGM